MPLAAECERRLKKYEDVRVQIYVYFQSCTGKIVKLRMREAASKASSGDDPMDVYYLVKGKSKRKSKGEGK